MDRIKRFLVFGAVAVAFILIVGGLINYLRNRTATSAEVVPTALPTLTVGLPTGQPTQGVSPAVPQNLATPTRMFWGLQNMTNPNVVHPEGWMDDFGRVRADVANCTWVFTQTGPHPYQCGYGTPFPGPEAWETPTP